MVFKWQVVSHIYLDHLLRKDLTEPHPVKPLINTHLNEPPNGLGRLLPPELTLDRPIISRQEHPSVALRLNHIYLS